MTSGLASTGRRAAFMAGVVAMAGAGAADAESLADAISLAYQSNPSLQSQRAQVRVLDEGYVQAVAGWRPQLGLQLSAGYTDQQALNFNGVPADTYSNTGQAQLGFSQPVFTGGRVASAVKAAGSDVLAGRQQLRAAEQAVLQSVVQAYADVLRDQDILKVREAELAVLQSQLDDAKARRGAGEVTETDVLQSLAQLQTARAQLSTAQGQLQVSRAAYVAAVGQNPSQLAPLPPMPGLPSDVDQAFDAAQAYNPSLNQARQTEEASRWRIAAARAASRPEVQIQGSYSYSGAVSPLTTNAYYHGFTAQAVLTQPLFTGGVNTSNIRRATALNDNDRIQIEAQRRQVVEIVSQTWNQILALKQSLVSNEQGVATARQYFADTEQEYRVGARSTLDVLVAEQTLRGSEVAVIQATHDAYVAQAALLAAMGRLSEEALVSGGPQYDASSNLRRVARAQAVPWQGVVARLDSFSGPRLEPASALDAPRLPDPPAPFRAGGAGVSVDAPPSTTTPTRPDPGAASPGTPARYGHDAAGSSSSPDGQGTARAGGIPALARRPLPTGSPPQPFSYAVASGDTLYALGRRFGLASGAIEATNGLVGRPALRAGARLKLPRAATDAGRRAHALGETLLDPPSDSAGRRPSVLQTLSGPAAPGARTTPSPGPVVLSQLGHGEAARPSRDPS